MSAAFLDILIYIMMSENPSSGLSTFIFKVFILICFFGVIPVTIAYVVKNYNQNAQGIINKQQAIEEIQVAVQDEIKVLTQQDAVALQKINDYIAGDWVTSKKKNYRIRYESDNSFSEYLYNKKIGYGLWRVTVKHNDANDVPEYPSPDDISTSTDYSDVDIYEKAAFRPDPSVSFYLLRTQFESGKKLEPIKLKITYITNSQVTLVDSKGKLTNFERSL